MEKPQKTTRSLKKRSGKEFEFPRSSLPLEIRKEKKILVVDPEEKERKKIVQFLKNKKFNIQEALCEIEIEKILKKDIFHLVILSLSIDSLYGESLLEKFTQKDSRIDFILLSEKGSVEEAVSSLKKGAWDFLVKPIKESLLVASVEKALENQVAKNKEKELEKEVSLLHFTQGEKLKEDHKSLNEKYTLFYSAFRHSTDAILITDIQGRIIETNQAFLDIFGYTLAEVQGEYTSILRSSKSTKEFYQEMWASINSTGEWKGEIVNCAKDGTEIPMWLLITPIYDQEKKIGYMGIEIDLREKKKMQARLLGMERVATIGQMSAQMAHEIRNPLSSISLNLELLQEELEGLESIEKRKEPQKLINSIASEVDRLNAVIQEYLAFSRLPVVEWEKVQVHTLLQDLVDFLKSEAKQKQIQIQYQQTLLPVIDADPNQLKQAFLNIIKNAMEAMPSGGTLTLSTALRNTEIEILIQDTGIGMTPEVQEKLYDPFFTTKAQGTGLGMATTFQIIGSHDGSIDCKSRVGEGTSFCIHLPFHRKKI
jgi:PAS domain S-box-containing protein